MPQPIFHQREQLRIIAGLSVEHAAGVQPGLIEPRREQVAGLHDPQDRPLCSGRDAGHEQHRRGIVAPAGTLPRDLVQRVEAEPFSGQSLINGRYAERQQRPLACAVAFQRTHGFAQFGKG